MSVQSDHKEKNIFAAGSITNPNPLFVFAIACFVTAVQILSVPLCPPDEVDYQLFDFYEETKVKFADLSESMLWEYIDSGEPM